MYLLLLVATLQSLPIMAASLRGRLKRIRSRWRA
jgi:hypothetical protein